MAKKQQTGTSTIFDDTYRTLIQKLPRLIVPVINEMFGTSYDLGASEEQLRNEQFSINRKLITDSIFQIANATYHIECQSTEDGTIALRMFEYDALIAMEGARQAENWQQVRFPYAGVLYLREPSEKTRDAHVEVLFPDGQRVVYQPKILSVSDYGLTELFQKNLLLLLPYYILRYERDLAEIAQNPVRAAKLLIEYQKINLMLQETFPIEENADAFLILRQLIKKISNYTLRREQTLREGVNDTMGGKILDLYVDRIERRGKREGMAEGEAKGEAKGRWSERLASIKNVMASTSSSAEKAMDILRIPQGERAALLAAL